MVADLLSLVATFSQSWWWWELWELEKLGSSGCDSQALKTLSRRFETNQSRQGVGPGMARPFLDEARI